MASVASIKPIATTIHRSRSTRFFLGHCHRNNPGATWRVYRDGPAPPNRFPDLPGRGPPRPLPPLPLRLQVLHPPPPLPRLLQLRPRHSMTSPQPPSDSSPSKTVRAVIKGRVQGVFYRNWTIENACQLGLKGWVRNRRDGSVEALFSGKPELVEEMQQRCRRGPPYAVVSGLEVFPATDDPGTGFERRPTV
ncbi:acylphosphatase [Rhodamnia argentea]|uniref:acylphosphatase n=1 Tax=Rhodamnia argentea TaxID=178133 RepID=A0ABM3HNP8_9MYRT|nr:acylphosphatase [Rhodamnia argentea]